MAQPGLLPAVEAAIARDTAGSPVDPSIRWTNRSASDLAGELQKQGFDACAETVQRILFEELGLSRRAAFKNEATCNFPQRDEQFRYIAQQRAKFERNDWPILSIDTKQKEILGNFYHPGQAYTDGRVKVLDHDFVTAEQRLVPYGVFDTRRNEALMYLARGADTCELACDAIWRWWRRLGQKHYWFAPKLLLLCDCGGSNSYRQLRFKEDLHDLAADLRCDIQVAHYPPGCSKYNPIEHRLFCHVTRSLQGVVLKTIQVARDFIARTHTTLGLRVLVEIARRQYQRCRPATPDFLAHNPILPNDFLPQLNYTAPWISPL